MRTTQQQTAASASASRVDELTSTHSVRPTHALVVDPPAKLGRRLPTCVTVNLFPRRSNEVRESALCQDRFRRRVSPRCARSDVSDFPLPLSDLVSGLSSFGQIPKALILCRSAAACHSRRHLWQSPPQLV